MSGKEAPNSRRLPMVSGREEPNSLPLPLILLLLLLLPPPSTTSTLTLKLLTHLRQLRFTLLNPESTSPKLRSTAHHSLVISIPHYLKLIHHPPNTHHLLLRKGSMLETNTNSNIHHHPCWKSGSMLGTRITTRSRVFRTLLTSPGLLKPTIRTTSSTPRTRFSHMLLNSDQKKMIL